MTISDTPHLPTPALQEIIDEGKRRIDESPYVTPFDLSYDLIPDDGDEGARLSSRHLKLLVHELIDINPPRLDEYLMGIRSDDVVGSIESMIRAYVHKKLYEYECQVRD